MSEPDTSTGADENLGHIDRIRAWPHQYLEPKHVEKAPRRERVKRTAWMIASTIACVFGGALVGAASLGGLSILFDVIGQTNPSAYAAAGVVLGAFTGLYLDVRYVFPWGVERFDIVLPWQFREVEAKDGE